MELARIFEPFYTTKGQGGTEQASVTYGIITIMALIEVESELGVGSKFTVWLPNKGIMESLKSPS
jgi:signal transduction histidine kinase